MSLPHDTLLFVAAWLLGVLVALPTVAVAWRRRRLAAIRELATALQEFSSLAERDPSAGASLSAVLPPLVACAQELQLRESAALALIGNLQRLSLVAKASAAQRVAQRLRRRVAFERKMLARTAPGRARGAVVAIIPLLAFLIMAVAERGTHGQVQFTELGAGAVVSVLVVEALGCSLLWRAARAEI